MPLNRLRLLALASAAVPLLGFSAAATFDSGADRGGGGGYAFTGSPTAHGRSCAVCHTGDQPAPQVEIVATDGLLTDGYLPGARYELTVALVVDRLGVDGGPGCKGGTGGCNRNGFAAEIVSGGGHPAGTICHVGMTAADPGCPSESDHGVALIANGSAVVGQSLSFPTLCDGTNAGLCLDVAGLSEADAASAIQTHVEGRRLWQISWRAPTHGRAPVDLFVAVVDGDGAPSFDPAYAGYGGDAVGVHRLRIPSALPSVGTPDASGCSASPHARGAGMAWLCLFFTCVLWARRRPRGNR